MTPVQTAVMIGLAALATQLTRWTPFLLFRRRTPKVISYLGMVLPAAIWGMLVGYCFRHGPLIAESNGLAEALAAAVTAALQAWRRNMALTIAGGTLCYMMLVRIFY